MFKRKKRGWFLYIVILASLFFLIHRFVISFQVVYRHTYSLAVYPFLLSQQYLISPIKTFFSQKKTQKELEKQLVGLQKKIEDLMAENIALTAISAHYDQIKEIIDFKKRYQFTKFMLSKVIFRHLTPLSHFIFINKGSHHGVEVDMVAVYKNCIIGKVIEAYPYFSKIILVTDKSCKVAVYCGKTRANGIHVGKNSIDATYLSHVSHLVDIQTDDFVVSSGDGLIFPKGFALGKVIAAHKGDLYYDVKVRPLFDIRQIDYCYVVKKGAYAS